MTYETHGLDTQHMVRFYEHDFYVLSNFSSFTLMWKGIRFDTLEAAYHWEKFVPQGFMGSVQAAVQNKILAAPSAHEAFQIAQQAKSLRRPDWDQKEVKVRIMFELLIEKVKQHEYVARKLLATGDRYLVEDSFRDSYWGTNEDWSGLNVLGQLWMLVRKIHRDGELEKIDPIAYPLDSIDTEKSGINPQHFGYVNDLITSPETPIKAVFRYMRKWGESTFGQGTASALIKRAKKEFEELEAVSSDEWTDEICEEMADILCIFTRAPKLWEAMAKKMQINFDRQWELAGDGTGTHIPHLSKKITVNPLSVDFDFNLLAPKD